jgi:NAD(P)-dependent dehydrogenase (short-subunit alcohol dehydrogenase family)
MICEPLELDRFTEPEEVAKLVRFLVSEDSSGITGRSYLMHTLWNAE